MANEFTQKKIQIYYHWVESNRYDKAIEAGHQVLAEDPENSGIHASLGHVYLQQDEVKKAKHHLKTALSIDADDPYARSMLALANMHGSLSSFSKVEREAINTLTMDPENFRAWRVLALSTVHYDEPFALQCCDRLIQLYPDDAWSYLTKADVIEICDSEPTYKAAQMLQSALILAPDDVEIHHSAAVFYLGDGADKKRGLEHLESALQIDPSHREATELAARLAMDKDWIMRILCLPKWIAGKLFDFICVWVDHWTFYIGWILALFLGVVSLWLWLVWLMVLMPAAKLYEWLIFRAEELRWHDKPYARIFAWPQWQRWLAWLGLAGCYLGGVAFLGFGSGNNYFETLYKWIATIVLWGFMPLALGITVWEWWQRRRLRKHMGDLPN